MSKLTRCLMVAATLAAISLAGMTTVAHAQANDEPTSSQDRRRPPTEGQVGESWRHQQVAPAIADNTRRPPTEAQVGESWHQRESVQARPADPTGYPGWLLASLGVVAVLALAGGLAVLAARWAGRKVRAGQAV
jgi:hypothetical protein